MPVANSGPLTDEEAIELDEFLLAAEGDEQRLPIDEAHGYLTGLVVDHSSLSTAEWMHAVWGEPAFKDDDEKQHMTDYLLRLHQDIALKLKEDLPFEPLAVEIEDEGETLIAHEGWCFGFMLAVTGDEQRWNNLPDNEQSLLAPIAKLALLYADETVEMEDDEYEMLTELLPGSVVGLYRYWHQQA
jgi:yecA family protein